MLGIKRSIMALLGIIVISALQFFLFSVLGMAIPLILMLLYYLGITSFTCAYAAYPTIERYMIDPYLDELTQKEDEESEA